MKQITTYLSKEENEVIVCPYCYNDFVPTVTNRVVNPFNKNIDDAEAICPHCKRILKLRLI